MRIWGTALFIFVFTISGGARASEISPTLEEFQKQAPFDPAEPLHAQTWVKFHEDWYQVDEFDPQMQTVSLVGSTLHYLKSKDLKNEEQVIGVDSFHLQAENKLVLTAIHKKIQIPFKTFNALLDTAVHLDAVTASPGAPLLGADVVFSGATKERITYSTARIAVSPYQQLHQLYSLPGSYPIEVHWLKNTGKTAETMPLQNFSKDMEKDVDVINVYTEKDPNKLFIKYESILYTDTGQTHLADVTPRPSNVYHFRLVSNTRAREITVYAPEAKTKSQDKLDFVQIDQLVRKIPRSLKDNIDEVYLDPGGLENKAFAVANAPVKPGQLQRITLYYLTGQDFSKASMVSSILSRNGINETFWHEISHHFQPKAATRIANFDWKIWENAIVEDQAWITPYSMTSATEDFPETLMKYVASDGGRTDPSLRKRVPHRFALLDRLLKTPTTYH